MTCERQFSLGETCLSLARQLAPTCSCTCACVLVFFNEHTATKLAPLGWSRFANFECRARMSSCSEMRFFKIWYIGSGHFTKGSSSSTCKPAAHLPSRVSCRACASQLRHRDRSGHKRALHHRRRTSVKPYFCSECATAVADVPLKILTTAGRPSLGALTFESTLPVGILFHQKSALTSNRRRTGQIQTRTKRHRDSYSTTFGRSPRKRNGSSVERVLLAEKATHHQGFRGSTEDRHIKTTQQHRRVNQKRKRKRTAKQQRINASTYQEQDQQHINSPCD